MVRRDAKNWINNPANGWAAAGNTGIEDGSYKLRVVPQYCLDGIFRDHWCEASGIWIGATHEMNSWPASSGTVWDSDEDLSHRFEKYKSGAIGAWHQLVATPSSKQHNYFPGAFGGSDYDNLKPSSYNFSWGYLSLIHI